MMRIRWSGMRPGLFTLGFLAIGAVPVVGVELKMVFKPGDVHRLRVESEEKSSMTMMGMPMNSTETSGFEYTFKVDKTDETGGAVVFVTFDWIQTKNSGMGGIGVVDYDSERDSEPSTAAKPYAALLGKTFMMSLSSNGKVQAVEGAGELVEEMTSVIEAGEGPMGAKAAQAITANIQKSWGQQGMRERMQQIFFHLPKKPVKSGGAWKYREETQVVIPMTTGLRLKVTKLTSDAVTASIKAKSKTKPKAKMEMGGASADVEGTGSGSGEMTVDAETGWPVASKYSYQAKAKISMKAPAGMPGGGGGNVEVPVEWKSKTTVSIPGQEASVEKTSAENGTKKEITKKKTGKKTKKPAKKD